MGCCVERADGATPGSGGGAPLGSIVLADLNFAGQPTVALADGAVNSLFGLTWTAANSANATTWRNLAGTGLQFAAAAVSTVYTTTTRSASRLLIAFSTLVPTWEPWWTILVESYWSNLTLPVDGNRVAVAFDNVTAVGGTGLIQAVGRRRAAGVQEGYGQVGLTFFANPSTLDVAAGRINGRGVIAMTGTYAAPNFPVPYPQADASLAAVDGQGTVMMPNASLVIAFPTGTIAGTMAATLERLRLSRIA